MNKINKTLFLVITILLIICFIVLITYNLNNLVRYYTERGQVVSLPVTPLKFIALIVFKLVYIGVIILFISKQSKISFILFNSFSIPIIFDLVSSQFRYYLMSFEPNYLQVLTLSTLFSVYVILYVNDSALSPKLLFPIKDFVHIILGMILVVVSYVYIINKL